MTDAIHIEDLVPAATRTRRGTVKPDGETTYVSSDGALSARRVTPYLQVVTDSDGNDRIAIVAD